MLENAQNVSDVTALGWAMLLGSGLGLASAAHCAGMCGGFPIMMVSGSKTLGARLRKLTLYNFGRGATYLILGTIAALVGAFVDKAAMNWINDGTLAWFPRALAVLIGVAMLISGLFLLGVRLPFFKEGHQGFFGEMIAKSGRSLFRSKSVFAPLSVGALNGLLPCPLVYAMLFSALNLGVLATWQQGAAGAAGFALGTMPVMFAIGIFGSAIPMSARQRFAKYAGVVLIVFSVVTVVRGVNIDFAHQLIPGSHVHAQNIGVGDDIYDPVTGERIGKPSDLSDEEWQEQRAEEHSLSEEHAIAWKSGLAEVRAWDKKVSEIDQAEGRHELTAMTLTKENIEDLRKIYKPDDIVTYRCACCGTAKEAPFRLFFPKTTLLFPADDIPISDRSDAE